VGPVVVVLGPERVDRSLSSSDVPERAVGVEAVALQRLALGRPRGEVPALGWSFSAWPPSEPGVPVSEYPALQ
jgi:hypothetical protein